MATATASSRAAPRDGEYTLVDPRAPRFGQAITATGLLLGIVLQAPIFVYAITAILLTAVLTRWKLHPYSLVWRHLLVPLVGRPDEPEPAAPHRFATVLGATGTTVATIAILAGMPLVGYVFAGAITAAAGLAAVTGLCLGCRMYESVALFRRLSIV